MERPPWSADVHVEHGGLRWVVAHPPAIPANRLEELCPVKLDAVRHGL